MSQLLQMCFTNWGINSDVISENGIRWHWAFYEDPRFTEDDTSDGYVSDNGYYGPDYNFNDGDW